ncbi:MAG: hypothetical protein QG646_450 [Euryarchaeota archaeon]|nr:hypothetical protein [Euryarchaeota archaeon]
MYIKTVSPDSGQVLYMNVVMEYSDYKVFSGRDEFRKYIINNIKVTETLTLEALAEDIKRILLSAGKLPENLEKTLIDCFGITQEAIPELVEYMFPSREKTRLQNKQISPKAQRLIQRARSTREKRTTN